MATGIKITADEMRYIALFESVSNGRRRRKDEAVEAPETPMAEAATISARESVAVAAEPKPAPTGKIVAPPVEAESGPWEWGRATNDPRINPAAPIVGPVLAEIPPSPREPVLESLPREIDVLHPSTWGRAANDPRAGEPQESPATEPVPEESVSAES